MITVDYSLIPIDNVRIYILNDLVILCTSSIVVTICDSTQYISLSSVFNSLYNLYINDISSVQVQKGSVYTSGDNEEAGLRQA